MNNNYNLSTDIKALQESTTFHMSLGSKELFHSNFLHWLSQVDWNFFMNVMHSLANEKEFWWEKTECTVEGHKGKFCPEKENIEVRREHHNFDLSIYILDSQYKKRNSKTKKLDDVEVEILKKDEDTIVQRWIPVFVLENKMKSLPYAEQLEEYIIKSYDEWKRCDFAKDDIEDIIKGANHISKHPITFVLLSLMATDLANRSHSIISIKQRLDIKKYSCEVNIQWVCKTYHDLLIILSQSISLGSKKLNNLIIKDYSCFLNALCNIAENDWTICKNDNYIDTVFPWASEKSEIRYKAKVYQRLRIHDIKEKIIYAQLLTLLEKWLESKEIPYKRYNKNFRADFKKQRKRLFTNKSYAHNIGIFEVKYIIDNVNNEKELFSLMIQLQGDNYCHMIIKENIVKEISNGKKRSDITVNEQVLSNDMKSKLDFFVNLSSKKKNRFPLQLNANTEPSVFHKYGNNLLYQSVKIPQNITIETIIEVITADIESIISKCYINTQLNKERIMMK